MLQRGLTCFACEGTGRRPSGIPNHPESYPCGVCQGVGRLCPLGQFGRMTPDARATYLRIQALRDEIGPIDFDIVGAIRELRNDR